VREFWRRTSTGRDDIAATDELVKSFEQMCDRAYREATGEDGTL
jgi:hypothetical protein